MEKPEEVKHCSWGGERIILKERLVRKHGYNTWNSALNLIKVPVLTWERNKTSNISINRVQYNSPVYPPVRDFQGIERYVWNCYLF